MSGRYISREQKATIRKTENDEKKIVPRPSGSYRVKKKSTRTMTSKRPLSSRRSTSLIGIQYSNRN